MSIRWTRRATVRRVNPGVDRSPLVGAQPRLACADVALAVLAMTRCGPSSALREAATEITGEIMRRHRYQSLERRCLLSAMPFETYPVPDVSAASDAIVRTETPLGELLIAEENQLRIYALDVGAATLVSTLTFDSPIQDVETGLDRTQLVATTHQVWRIERLRGNFGKALLFETTEEIVEIAESHDRSSDPALFIAYRDRIVSYDAEQDRLTVEVEGDVITMFSPPTDAISPVALIRGESDVAVTYFGATSKFEDVIASMGPADRFSVAAVGDYISSNRDDIIVASDRGELLLITGVIQYSQYYRVAETTLLREPSNSETRFKTIIADLDNNRLFDQVVIASDGEGEQGRSVVTWHENTGNGFAEHPLLTKDSPGVEAFTVDLDDDGDFEILLMSRGDFEVIEFSIPDAAEVSFEGASFGSGVGPAFFPHVARSVDFDRDGDLDVVAGGAGHAGDTGNAGIVWYQNLGNGVFGNAETLVDIAAFDFVSAMTIEDVDADGRFDIFFRIYVDASDKHSFRLLRQLSDGTFSMDVVHELRSRRFGHRPNVVEDFDGDGDIHLFTFDSWVENIDGQFETLHPLFDGRTPHSVAVDDADNDGDPDIAALFAQTTGFDLKFFANEGSRFTEQVILEDRSISGSRDLMAFANLDRDPELELIVGNRYFDQSTGRFGPDSNLWFEPSTFLRFPMVVAEDLDEDGVDELLLGAIELSMIRRVPEPGSTTVIDELPPNGFAPTLTSIEWTDLDGDGIRDLLIASPTDLGVVWYAGERTGGDVQWSNRRELRPEKFIGVENSILVDFNGDSFVDVLANDEAGRYGWYRNRGGEVSTDGTRISVQAEHLVPLDFDSDGDLDLFAINMNRPEASVRWLENDGQGSFSQARPVAIEGDTTKYPQLLSHDVADVDGDGDDDLVIGPGYYDAPIWFENRGPELPLIRHALTGQLQSFHATKSFVEIVDIDHDGDQDIIATSHVDIDDTSAYEVEWFENVGQATFVLRPLDYERWYAEYGPSIRLDEVQVIDVDGENDVELVLLTSFGALLFDVEGEEVIRRRLTGPDNLIAAFDIDDDGDVDLLGVDHWYENQGQLDFVLRPHPIDAWVTTNTTSVGVLDLDNDGDDDFVGYNQGLLGSLTVLLNEASAAVDFDFDINLDGAIDGLDVDALCFAVSQGMTDERFDADGDGEVGQRDLLPLLERLNSVFGDANFDGMFGASDLVQILAAGLYGQGQSEDAVWSSGDFNCDGQVDSSDLVLAMQNSPYR